MRYTYFLTLVLGLLSARAFGQAPAPHLDSALVSYFSGEWAGEGAFANGKPISADLSFHLSLDSAWLVYEHRDRAPNEYKATSYWGVDGQSGLFQELRRSCFDTLLLARILRFARIYLR